MVIRPVLNRRARYWGGGSDTHLGSDTFLSQSFFELATTACIITFAKAIFLHNSMAAAHALVTSMGEPNGD